MTMTTEPDNNKMNTMPTITETTCDLRSGFEKCFSKNGQKFRITVKIRLNDECQNGHEDFSITGDMYIHDEKRHRWLSLSSGCIHDEIAEAFPYLQPFIDLHLSDYNGVPMHAVSDGRYHLQNGKMDYAKSALRVTDEELNILNQFKNDGEMMFGYQMEKLGLRKRYQKEADTAIAFLENKTGKRFESKSTKSHGWEPLSEEQVAELQKMEAAGYFTPEAAAKRSSDKKEAAYQELLTDREKNFAKETEESTNKYMVEMAIIHTLKMSSYNANIIYYSHTNEISANWRGEYPQTDWNEETLKNLEVKMREYPLPPDVRFTVSKNH